MNVVKRNKLFATIALSTFLASQVLLISSTLLLPKRAEAFFGVTFNTEIASPYKVLKDIGVAALKTTAMKISEKFLSRFTNKLVDKYKIRNFLYYDQVLTSYYLTNFIRDKISDPDLREVFDLLEAGYISGRPTYTKGQPDPREALIPRLKTSINKLYMEGSGINPAHIANPPVDMSDAEYLSMSQQFYFNNEAFTGKYIAEFQEHRSAASTASMLEVIVGQGLKSGRSISGNCQNAYPDASASADSSRYSFASTADVCTQQGGTWLPDALDQTRSFIQNPSRHIDAYLNSAVYTRLHNSFDPNNYWSRIGSALGSFLFNQFFLDKNGYEGVLNEVGTNSGYRALPPAQVAPEGNPIDLDFDGIVDGYDFTNDGVVDICTISGTAPNCEASSQATTYEEPAGNNCLTIRTPYPDPVTGNTEMMESEICS